MTAADADADAGSVRELLSGPVLDVARALLGAQVTTALDDGAVVVRLTEVEAYGGADDPGSHAARGRTARNVAMFGPPGHLYVYRHLGLHHCVNVVVGPVGEPAAVLLRAGEVVTGRSTATARRARRGVTRSVRDFAAGPARLAVALGVELAWDGLDLLDPVGPVRLALAPAGLALAPAGEPAQVRTGPRVGVAGRGGEAVFAWRLWLADEPTVSPYRRAAPRRTRASRGPFGTAD